jgi:hypothetical protein
VLLLPVSALAWRWRFFRLSFRVWMMSFTFPHGVLCAFWWGSFPVPVLATPSYTLHHILHRSAHQKAKAISDPIHCLLCNWSFHNKEICTDSASKCKFWMFFASLFENCGRTQIILFYFLFLCW